MIIDNELMFSDGQAETTVAEHASTNVVDLGAAGDAHIAPFLCILVATAAASAGAATVQFKLETDSDSEFGTAETLYDSGALDYADLAAGTWVCRTRLPRGLKRYLRVTYTIATAALTAGAFDAFITPEVDTNE
jgi:hypothetical protein